MRVEINYVMHTDPPMLVLSAKSREVAAVLGQKVEMDSDCLD